MARDHRRLRVFADAHQLTLAIYKHTRGFPRDEWYALRLQMRKAAVSIPSNIVEGNARRTTKEYVHFLNIGYASAAELTFLVDLASELSYLSGLAFRELNDGCARVCRQMQALLYEMERRLIEEEARRPRAFRPRAKDRRPKTEDETKD